MARLRRSNCEHPGYSRRRWGKGFSYRDIRGGVITDRQVLARIRSLAIPPAWTSVWISPYANGHIQATGTDGAGRKQYIYHPHWREMKDREKFDRALAFAQSLPPARRLITKHLRAEGVGPERALAAALRIVDAGALRVGGTRYAEANGSYGTTTLRIEHVNLAGTEVRFDFPGKSGQEWHTSINDEDLAAALEPMLERPGADTALAYIGSDGSWHSVDAAALNAFLKEVTGGDFSAKDFRTWQATVVAAMSLARLAPEAVTKRAKLKAVAATARDVADHLGNTPAIARKSYIDPRVVDRFFDGDVIPVTGFSASETAVRLMLED
ncbi:MULTISPECIES: DNA topoisomerase IB [unclassified Arthrobacter]|uniref:DNA topoisomerase IB n=1 Tax=unclassified Arthrobacter TaxID=235627 RepID=UPI001D13F8D6|nr:MULTISPECIES: DNA topoisomerase IB [unclassified Arthrobacter]MCC3275806.1 DNA topoisomerase IB [Arthrobacter sp. zg-Y20]MCC3278769.1 DNA topoisomerase IB [Arthrobacter sp. zg-Y40]MCC9177143.1 DNA topoisomerase IB [Arthrobacter sp. zg-Y750]MDK1315963.1 DNA topoisomerase IB [Arthrobacter sp. zg.Y20]WIB06260.1 DNA topoisomerase IB [Arthrobacter sp. zg-Y20]